MTFSQWFHDQLQASADGFVWGAQQVPNARRNVLPPEALGEWTAARHIFHIILLRAKHRLAIYVSVAW